MIIYRTNYTTASIENSLDTTVAKRSSRQFLKGF